MAENTEYPMEQLPEGMKIALFNKKRAINTFEKPKM
jgi:hypothetical protein